jgi:succinyl-CoA synthetase beta subunit
VKIHEYQAKEVLARYGVPVPRGIPAGNVEEARAAATELGGKVVVKAQIHAGGRGKGGGVKLAGSVDEAVSLAEAMLGMCLVTPQTGPEGRTVRRLLIAEALDIEKEYYLSLIVDRATARVSIIASAEGGVEIEKVAAERPEAILRATIDPVTGYQPWVGRRVAFGLGLGGKQVGAFAKMLGSLYSAFMHTDASLAEINPLVTTKDGQLLALDAKMTFDDSALFRRPEIAEFRDLNEEEPLEIEAGNYDLNYIKLDGNVGCMVNGAGLAMATMDIIKLSGGEPANFLDVGGGASAEQVENAFRILLSDKAVKGVLINIFGGILRCDTLAEGVVAAVKKLSVGVPVVVRMEGTNVDRGRQILQESGMDFIVAEGLKDAAEKAVAAATRAS